MKSESKPSPTSSRVSPLISLMQLHPLLPPKFPTWSELTQTPSDSPRSSRRQGLFDSLIGDPHVMFDDLLRDPSKYEEGVAELLMSLVSGRRKLIDLSPTEMEALDRATLDFNRLSSLPKPDKPPETSLETKTPKPSSKDSELQKESQVPEDLIPDESLIPEWFR